MLSLSVQINTVERISAGSLIRVDDDGKAVLGILVRNEHHDYLLGFDLSPNSPEPYMLLPIASK